MWGLLTSIVKPVVASIGGSVVTSVINKVTDAVGLTDSDSPQPQAQPAPTATVTVVDQYAGWDTGLDIPTQTLVDAHRVVFMRNPGLKERILNPSFTDAQRKEIMLKGIVKAKGVQFIERIRRFVQQGAQVSTTPDTIGGSLLPPKAGPSPVALPAPVTSTVPSNKALSVLTDDKAANLIRTIQDGK